MAIVLLANYWFVVVIVAVEATHFVCTTNEGTQRVKGKQTGDGTSHGANNGGIQMHA